MCSVNARWVAFTSVHWYKATSETYNTPATLLEEDPIRKEMANLEEIVRVSNRWGRGGCSRPDAAQLNRVNRGGGRGGGGGCALHGSPERFSEQESYIWTQKQLCARQQHASEAAADLMPHATKEFAVAALYGSPHRLLSFC